MKSKLFGFLIIMVFSIIYISTAHATASREIMEKYFPKDVLDSLDEETYKEYAEFDYDNAITKEVKIPNTDYVSDIAPNSKEIATRGSAYSTNYKVLSLNAVPIDDKKYIINMTLQWKVMPAVRSFDVIALRFENMAMSMGTQYGYQTYTGGNVSYSYNGTNMNLQSNGFGISMNLVNNSVNHLQCYISTQATKANGAKIFGAYEHATSSISLANSKKYTLNYIGMGDVINFYPAVWPIYDQMQGVSFTL